MRRYWKVAGGLGLIAVLILLYYRVNPAQYSLFPKCPFYALTGWHCPGCGSQRAVHQLLQGHWQKAAGYNLLLVLAMPLLLYVGGVQTLDYLRGTRTTLSFLYNQAFAYGVLICVLVFWLLRNLPLVPFHYLAP